MAKHRMIARTISTDEKVAMLSCPAAMLLWTWMIPHADNLGRMRGEAEHVRLTVMPRVKGVTTIQVGKWLEEMVSLELIERYSADGIWVVQLKAWNLHQKLMGNMTATSELPEVCTAFVPSTNGICSARAEREREVERERERETVTAVTIGGAILIHEEVKATVEKSRALCATAGELHAKARALRREQEEAFDTYFWPPYPRKVAKDAALEAFRKVCLTDDDLTDIIEGLEWYKHGEWVDRPMDKITHASTWLNQGRWKDAKQGATRVLREAERPEVAEA